MTNTCNPDCKVNFELIYQELKNSILRSEPLGVDIKDSIPVTYVKEFRTIGIQAPRQTGKTTFIIKKAVEENGIIVVGHHTEKTRIKSKLPDESKNIVFTIEEIFNHKNTEIPKVKYIFIEKKDVTNEHWLAIAITELMGTDIIIVYFGS